MKYELHALMQLLCPGFGLLVIASFANERVASLQHRTVGIGRATGQLLGWHLSSCCLWYVLLEGVFLGWSLRCQIETMSWSSNQSNGQPSPAEVSSCWRGALDVKV